ncbi:MAG: carbon starvation protein A [Bacteroidales bacterium]|nr:carbon starvation protein A [Bacteroidales bacterium]
MITFITSIVLLILGFLFYGKFVEKRLFAADPNRVTPAVSHRDGVDFQPLKPWRIFVIQFLNIAGLGPIFGAILGAAYGPLAYVWIVVGCIFMGAVHDFFAGMISLRSNGRGAPSIIGMYLGKGIKILMQVFVAVLLIGIGCSFVTGPADLLNTLAPVSKLFWVIIIFVYYILATLVPIDKIIGRIYPYLGAVLLFMAVAVGCALIVKGLGGSIQLTELTFDNFRNFHSNPDKFILFPMLFIVISCGAISGFHSTQSPIMARCLPNEKYGRPVFYGAMICEGIVAAIWATTAMAYTDGPEGLNAAAAAGNTPAILVNAICKDWLGKVGAVVALLGVIACPITSGDTAFRSLRLIVADAFHIGQKPILNRIGIAFPMFAIAVLVCTFDFSTIWNYVGISNQVLASIVLWTATRYLYKHGKNPLFTGIPATFLTYVCVCYFMVAPGKAGGLSLPVTTGHIVAAVATIAVVALFSTGNKKLKRRPSK